MRRKTIKVLLIEDDEEDYILTRELFEDIPERKYQLEWAASFEAGVKAIQENGFDIYLVDYRLGRENGLELLNEVSKVDAHCPFILLTGLDNRDLDIEAMEAGASDFLVKGNLTADLLDRSIRYAIRQQKIIHQLKQQRQELEQQSKELRIKSIAIDSAAMPIAFADLEGKLSYVNKAYLKMWGYDEPQDIIGKPTSSFGNDPQAIAIIMESINSKGYWTGEDTAKRRNGIPFEIWVNASLIKDEVGQPIMMMASFLDLTELKQRERELKKEKELAQTYLNIAGSIIIVINEEGIIQLANQMATEVSGYKEMELIGKDWFECCVPPINRVDRRETFRKLMRGEKNVTHEMVEHIMLIKGGKERTIFWQNRLLKGTSDKPAGLIISGIDVTEQRKMEKDLEESRSKLQKYNDELEKMVADRTTDLRESETKLKSAQEIAGVGYWEYDISKQALKWSDELYQIFEIDSEETPSLDKFLALIHPQDRSTADEITRMVMETGQRMKCKYRIITYDQEVKHLQGYIERKPGTELGTYRLFGVTQDVTTHKKAEEQLAHALKKEKELSELKSRFVSMASHEFRTPLTSILGSADLIEMHAQLGKLEKFPRHISRIKSSVDNLISILNDFLSLEKLESGKVLYQPESVEMCSYAEQILDEVNLLTKGTQKIRFVHQGENHVKIDKHLVKNIIINLVSNAVKYSPKDKDVDLNTARMHDKFFIEVKDRGIGIPEKDQKLMFSRFFRASNVESIKGTGLGLTIVKRYLDIMGGKISFESKEGDGTTFRVEIPQTETE